MLKGAGQMNEYQMERLPLEIILRSPCSSKE